MTNIAFIDLEASGLDARSWPIEVGWGMPDGEPTAFLIRPDETWERDVWMPEAQALHKISMDQLDREGVAAQTVCAQLNEALGGHVVYSDAPDWDGFWLYRLFLAADIRQQFTLSDFRGAFIDLGVELTPALIAEASRETPHLHRAADDVRHMQALYRLASAQG